MDREGLMGFNIDLVDSNPHRNFDLYPIDKEQVGKLKASFKTIAVSGPWRLIRA
jgi:hypothetical protein